MTTRCLTVAAILGALAGVVLAGEKAQDNKLAKPDKAAKVQQAPSLEQLKAAIQPMLEAVDLTSEQKNKVSGALSEDGWETALRAFDKRRSEELRALAHKAIPEAMPTIMMPKMMAHNMQKMMKEHMAREAGPPTPKEIEAIRAATRARLRATLAPTIMGKVEELTATRMRDVLSDKKTLVRVLAESVSEAALTDKQTEEFNKILTEAGYLESLVHGPDPVLMKQVNTMLEKVADEAIEGLEKADDSGKETEESQK